MVLIPAMNEEATVAEVVRQFKSAGVRWVRVVDNGSTDDTGPTARRAGAEVIAEPRRGYGRACWTGLQSMPEDCHWVLFCDADGSDDLGQLGEFFSAARKADLVLGNRCCRDRREDELRGDWIIMAMLLLSPVANPWCFLWILPFAARRLEGWHFGVMAAVSLSYLLKYNLGGEGFDHPVWVRPLEIAVALVGWWAGHRWLKEEKEKLSVMASSRLVLRPSITRL